MGNSYLDLENIGNSYLEPEKADDKCSPSRHTDMYVYYDVYIESHCVYYDVYIESHCVYYDVYIESHCVYYVVSNPISCNR